MDSLPAVKLLRRQAPKQPSELRNWQLTKGVLHPHPSLSAFQLNQNTRPSLLYSAVSPSPPHPSPPDRTPPHPAPTNPAPPDPAPPHPAPPHAPTTARARAASGPPTSCIIILFSVPCPLEYSLINLSPLRPVRLGWDLFESHTLSRLRVEGEKGARGRGPSELV